MIGYSDHRLVKVHLNSAWPRPTRVMYTFCDLKKDILSFTTFIWNSKLMTSPSNDPDEAAKQFHMGLSAGLDQFTSLHTRSRHQSIQYNKWISAEAHAAKLERRRLKRRLSKSKTPTNKQDYRAACQRTCKLIQESSFMCEKVTSVSDNLFLVAYFEKL